VLHGDGDDQQERKQTQDLADRDASGESSFGEWSFGELNRGHI
jgi:hypothetical protein